MENPPEQIQSELDSFREQWRAEVSARAKNPSASAQQQQKTQAGTSVAEASSSSRAPRRKIDQTVKTVSSSSAAAAQNDDDEDFDESRVFGDDPSTGKDIIGEAGKEEPQTALEFYEKAVDKETTGNLGDSLRLYRQAYRLDTHVDRTYREKHFPGTWKKKPLAAVQESQPKLINAPATAPDTAPPADDPKLLTLPELIASFAELRVQGAPPVIAGTPAPPCPISELPDEILIHILEDVAILDVADFVRLSSVCKRLAYLVATETRIWRRICLGPEFGFGGMFHHFQKEITWEELGPDSVPDEDTFNVEEIAERQLQESEATTNALFSTAYPSWQRMFRQRPRVRFNGCYISTVNYIRTGQASGNYITWNSPVHIVTYYRYLRLYRDGTAISLLTTTEPADVVHHMTKAVLQQHENNGAPHLQSAIMSQARKGRWRLSSPLDNPDVSIRDAEGTLFVETEGVASKYTNRLEFTLRSAGKARNNKLLWKAHWYHNKLTDDWAEFALKNDKAYYFSRVKSYGLGWE